MHLIIPDDDDGDFDVEDDNYFPKKRELLEPGLISCLLFAVCCLSCICLYMYHIFDFDVDDDHTFPKKRESSLLEPNFNQLSAVCCLLFAVYHAFDYT